MKYFVKVNFYLDIFFLSLPDALIFFYFSWAITHSLPMAHPR